MWGCELLKPPHMPHLAPRGWFFSALNHDLEQGLCLYINEVLTQLERCSTDTPRTFIVLFSLPCPRPPTPPSQNFG